MEILTKNGSLYKKTDDNTGEKLSPLLIGFSKNYNAQHCLSKMIEKWRNKLDKGKFIGLMFIYLLKAFDSINRNLLIAKLRAYGFSRISLQLMRKY